MIQTGESYLACQDDILRVLTISVVLPQSLVMTLFNAGLGSGAGIVIVEVDPYWPGSLSLDTDLHLSPGLSPLLGRVMSQHGAEQVRLCLAKVGSTHAAPQTIVSHLQQSCVTSGGGLMASDQSDP